MSSFPVIFFFLSFYLSPLLFLMFPSMTLVLLSLKMLNEIICRQSTRLIRLMRRRVKWTQEARPQSHHSPVRRILKIFLCSVRDPDPPDLHVFGPPGSGSISQRYGSESSSGSGSGSFYDQAKIVRKILISTVLWPLLGFLSLKNNVKVPSKSNSRNTFLTKISFLLASWRSVTKRAGSGSESGFGPDPLVLGRIRGYGSRSTPKCHGFGTLFRWWVLFFIFFLFSYLLVLHHDMFFSASLLFLEVVRWILSWWLIFFSFFE